MGAEEAGLRGEVAPVLAHGWGPRAAHRPGARTGRRDRRAQTASIQCKFGSTMLIARQCMGAGGRVSRRKDIGGGRRRDSPALGRATACGGDGVLPTPGDGRCFRYRPSSRLILSCDLCGPDRLNHARVFLFLVRLVDPDGPVQVHERRSRRSPCSPDLRRSPATSSSTGDAHRTRAVERRDRGDACKEASRAHGRLRAGAVAAWPESGRARGAVAEFFLPLRCLCSAAAAAAPAPDYRRGSGKCLSKRSGQREPLVTLPAGASACQLP